ncbi:MAG: hypothetical protein ACK5Q5_10200 [Planctomycetaceae bacterium]
MSSSLLTSIASCLALALTSVVLIADDVGVPDLDASRKPEAIQAAVDQLASLSAAERNVAEQRLLEQGPAILARLPAESDVSDAAVKDALRRIRMTLEQRVNETAVHPSRVTLAGRRSLSDVVNEVQRQSGNRIDLAADSDDARQITVDWQQLPFWSAVQDLAVLAKLDIDQQADPRRVVLVRPTGRTRPRDERPTPFLVSTSPLLVQIENSPEMAVSQSPNDRLVRLRLRLLAEPRLWPLFVAVRDQDLQLRIGTLAVSPFNPLASREIEFDETGTATFDYVGQLLQQPEADAEGWALSGDLELELVALTHEFRWNRWSETAPRRIRRGAVSATLDTVRFDPERRRADVRFIIRYDAGGPAFESHRIATLLQSAAVEFADGRRINSLGSPELTREQDGTLGAQYRFEGLSGRLDHSTLLLEAPASLSRVRIRFESSDRLKAVDDRPIPAPAQ